MRAEHQYFSGDSPPITACADLPPDPLVWREFADELIASADACGFAKADRFAIRLAFEEAIVNAFRHGHAAIPDEPVNVDVSIEDGKVRIAIHDRGPGFDPEEVPDPRLDENLENPGGRGLMLIRAYMARVEFADSGRRLEMTYLTRD